MSFRRAGAESDRCDNRNFSAGRVVAEQLIHEHEPVTQKPRREEVATDELLASQCTLASLLWIAQNLLLVASTMLRTLDYVEAYSLTELRIAALN